MRLSAESRYASFAEVSFRIEGWILQRIKTQIILTPLKTAKNLKSRIEWLILNGLQLLDLPKRRFQYTIRQ
jgi:hypothetical protein